MDKKKLIMGGVAVILIAGGVFLFTGKSSKGGIKLETAKVGRSTITNTVTATGTVEPVTEVEVGTQVSGIIDKLYADYNDVVKAGQLIAEMDKINLQAELRSAEAQLASSKTEFEYQQKNYARSKVLHEKQLISDTDYETATYNYEKARAAYDQSQASMVKVNRNLEYATITSPIDGVVINRAVEEGQTVAAGFETPTLFTIAADLTKMQVIADVDEADIGNVEEGQRVSFTVDAYPNDQFEGVVRQIRLGDSESTSSASSSTSSSTVVTYEVVITADNPDLKLKPRLTANITIYTLERANILTLPNKALRFIPEPAIMESLGMTVTDPNAEVQPGKRLVWSRQGNTLSPRQITVGTSNNSVTEVTEGLSEGDEVAVDLASAANMPEVGAGAERSPFMPGPPGSNFHVGDETVHALRGVSFTIREGEFVTIMGTSGSGKSTLLNTLGCLDTPTSGEYYLDGVSVRTMNKRQRATLRNRKIGFVFQNYNLLPKTTAVENVELPLMYNPTYKAAQRREKAVNALIAVGLGDRLMHKSNQMSGGQMQRVAIARALVNDPAVILADEATGNLDTRTSFEILVLFQRLHAEGRTIIFVTHNPEIAQYSSRNITLRDGHVTADTVNTNILSAAEALARLPKNDD